MAFNCFFNGLCTVLPRCRLEFVGDKLSPRVVDDEFGGSDQGIVEALSEGFIGRRP